MLEYSLLWVEHGHQIYDVHDCMLAFSSSHVVKENRQLVAENSTIPCKETDKKFCMNIYVLVV